MTYGTFSWSTTTFTQSNTAAATGVSATISCGRTDPGVGLEHVGRRDRYLDGSGGAVTTNANTGFMGTDNLAAVTWNGTSSLMLSELAATRNTGEVVTFTFSPSLTWMTFSISDIDTYSTTSGGLDYGFMDLVVVSVVGGATITATSTDAGMAIGGSGTSTVTVRQNSTGIKSYTADQGATGLGVVRYVVCGPVSSMTIRYTNPCACDATAPTSPVDFTYIDQQVYVSPLTVQTGACSC